MYLMICLLLPCLLPGQNRNSSLESDETTITGTVVSSSRNTITVRTEGGQYQVFVLDGGTVRPATIPAGSRVRVISTSSGEAGVRSASNVVIAGTAPAGQQDVITGSNEVPPAVRNVEREIERQVRRFQVGVRGGMALDPELVTAGVHAQFNSGFSRNIFIRPSVEFGWGEVTTLFALNLEGIYRLPISPRGGRWAAYMGVGPGFTFLHQDFERGDRNIDFGEFHSDVGLNILGGIQYRSGMFFELRTSVYARPAPTLRFLVGYNF